MMTYAGIAGGIDQNVGGTQSVKYGGGTSAVLGAAAVERAFADGYEVSDITAWAEYVNAIVGDKAKTLLNLA
jgi:hypothetical protein